MPRTSPAASTPTPDDDRAFREAFDALSAYPRRERNAILAFILWWLELPKPTRAIMAKIVKPAMTNQDIATLVGVNRKTLGSWEAFRQSKPDRSDYTRVERKPSKRRRIQGSWWPLDHPDCG